MEHRLRIANSKLVDSDQLVNSASASAARLKSRMIYANQVRELKLSPSSGVTQRTPLVTASFIVTSL